MQMRLLQAHGVPEPGGSVRGQVRLRTFRFLDFMASPRGAVLSLFPG